LKVEFKKTQEYLKALDKGQLALQKYTVDANSLSYKDWGDIITLVFPKAKVDLL
jgi:hypothetical protein